MRACGGESGGGEEKAREEAREEARLLVFCRKRGCGVHRGRGARQLVGERLQLLLPLHGALPEAALRRRRGGPMGRQQVRLGTVTKESDCGRLL